MRQPRLLYLGNAFPPGVAALHPELQPAGHLIETNLIRSIAGKFEIRSTGISEVDPSRLNLDPSCSPGLPNVLNLLDRPPALWNWIRSLRRLRKSYASWLAGGWEPDLIVVCNFSPVYNAFVRGMSRLRTRPRLVLYIADSTLLGVPIGATRCLRYRVKPFKWMDDEMAALYDACVATSADTEGWFRSRKKPWLWLPNGMDPARIRNGVNGPDAGPIVFGYFGHAGEHTGVPQLLRLFAARRRNAELRVCAFGKARAQLVAAYGCCPEISFHGPFDPEGCVDFGTCCDVLVNPRPIVPGNENNFSSKVFEYALAGRCVLTSRLSGVGEVLGSEACYFDARDYESSLSASLDRLAATDREDLRRRGAAIQQRLCDEFSWAVQGQKLAGFLGGML
ncbi:MAG: glycosyltransferase family 4 protein [Verrucomicrobia bacterium]|jgi:glycosyltransferase involved in cell wall biosynthesis|nr:glycosyltransferase family 4 protein [Verrucomicrobiota bacterium]